VRDPTWFRRWAPLPPRLPPRPAGVAELDNSGRYPPVDPGGVEFGDSTGLAGTDRQRLAGDEVDDGGQIAVEVGDAQQAGVAIGEVLTSAGSSALSGGEAPSTSTGTSTLPARMAVSISNRTQSVPGRCCHRHPLRR